MPQVRAKVTTMVVPTARLSTRAFMSAFSSFSSFRTGFIRAASLPGRLGRTPELVRADRHWRFTPSSGQRADCKGVEMGNAVGLGPQGHLPRSAERAVACREQL